MSGFEGGPLFHPNGARVVDADLATSGTYLLRHGTPDGPVVALAIDARPPRVIPRLDPKLVALAIRTATPTRRKGANPAKILSRAAFALLAAVLVGGAAAILLLGH